MTDIASEIERQDRDAMRKLDVESQVDEMVLGSTTTERKMARTIARLLNKVDRLEAKQEGIQHDIDRIRSQVMDLVDGRSHTEQMAATAVASTYAAKAAVAEPFYRKAFKSLGIGIVGAFFK